MADSTDTVSVAELRYSPDPARGAGTVSLCFPLPDPSSPVPAPGGGFPHGAALAEVSRTADHPEVVAIGFATAVENGFIGAASNAALAVRAMGHSPRLVWYQPGLGDLDTGPGAAGAWPAWLGPGTLLVMSAVVLLAVVRGRRLGRLVPEPLPVVVRAVETTESRARMYRAARDRGRSAALLREGTARRLGSRLALPPTAGPGVLVPLAARSSGLPPDLVGALLFGPAPTDDDELLRLAQQLTDLEERVLRS